MLPIKNVPVLDYKLASITLKQAASWCLSATKNPIPKLLVTLNPEIIVQAQKNVSLKQALQSADLSVADGVGLLWAAKRFGHNLPERVAGVELTSELLTLGGKDLRVFFLGAKPGIAQKAALEAQQRFEITIAGTQHGYFDHINDAATICQQVKDSQANLLLAGLGEGQELFLHKHRAALNTSLMIGVGGTLDVLSGEVKRTPLWTRKLGLEWAYRIASDRKRWNRFPRLAQFVGLVLRARKAGLRTED